MAIKIKRKVQSFNIDANIGDSIQRVQTHLNNQRTATEGPLSMGMVLEMAMRQFERETFKKVKA